MAGEIRTSEDTSLPALLGCATKVQDEGGGPFVPVLTASEFERLQDHHRDCRGPLFNLERTPPRRSPAHHSSPMRRVSCPDASLSIASAEHKKRIESWAFPLSWASPFLSTGAKNHL